MAPKKRIVRLGGEDIDVSVLSVRVALKFIEFKEKFNFDEEKEPDPEDFNPEVLAGMAEVLAAVCEKSSKKITADWLMNNLDMSSFIKFMQFALQPMMERIKSVTAELPKKSSKGEPEKN